MKNYVKKYMGHDVPEGATDVSDFPNPQPIEFYRAIGGNHQYFNVGDNNPVWCKSIFNEPNKYAVPLPEEPMPSKAEWMPNKTIFWVAKLDKYGTPWNSDGPHESYKDAESSIKLLDSLSEDTHTVTKMEFFCLKTAEEKKREAFIEGVKQLFPKSDTDDLILAGKLFDAGYTAPKEGGL